MGYDSTNNQQQNNCFSKENFQKVYGYIENKINEDGSSFFVFKEYEVHITKKEEIISIKKNGYTLSKIEVEKGIYSLNKSEKQNKKMVNLTHNIFCELLSIANK